MTSTSFLLCLVCNFLAQQTFADQACLDKSGQCQEDSLPCNGQYESGLCSGGTTRRCCVPYNDGQCDAVSGTCQEDSTACSGQYETGLCGGGVTRRCCVPNDDGQCDAVSGTCQEDSTPCNGQYQTGLCGGWVTRRCCVPYDDSACGAVSGTCQLNTVACTDGQYRTGLCGGPTDRQCCVKTEGSDDQCTSASGVCQEETISCNGEYKTGLCSGAATRKCCVPYDDSACSAVAGTCQLNTVQCTDGQYRSGLCGGATNRQCCVQTGGSDDQCTSASGVCQEETVTCNGQYQTGLCSGAATRKCCVPYDDSACTAASGTCQINTVACTDGQYRSGLCGGPTNRQCCVKTGGSDDQCTSASGVCQEETVSCNGEYKTGLCSGAATRKCCVPYDDSGCSAVSGTCQLNTIACTDGQYRSGLCGGPTDRQCCVQTGVSDDQCTSASGVCQEETVSCNGEYRTGLCSGAATRKCCVPYDDSQCTAVSGVCQQDSGACNGDYKTGLCGGDATRRCCAPYDDSACTAKKGTCKINTEQCDGIYKAGLCGGGANRQCCEPVPPEDKPCAAVGGTCVMGSEPCGDFRLGLCGGDLDKICCVPEPPDAGDYWCKTSNGVCQENSTACIGGIYTTGLCAGGATRQCCVKTQQADAKCQNANGVCQITSTVCSGGKYFAGLCSGPTNRQCCVPSDKDSQCHIEGGTCKPSCKKGQGQVSSASCNNKGEICCVSGRKGRDAKCLQAKGTCRLPKQSCNGELKDGLCRGRRFKCCIQDPDGDAKCTSKGGKCVTKQSQCKGGNLEINLCSGTLSRKCCLPKKEEEGVAVMQLRLYAKGSFVNAFAVRMSPEIKVTTPVTKPSHQGLVRNKKLTFVIHGWRDSHRGMAPLRRALNQKKEVRNGDEAFFMVDWSIWSKNWCYPIPCKQTDIVGQALAAFIMDLKKRHLAEPGNIHLIGHSLGGKVSAAAAAHLGNLKLGRISGLDVPLYCVSLQASDRVVLDPSDAEFVDTVRTTILSGNWGQTQGHADFFTCPNCTSADKVIKDPIITLLKVIVYHGKAVTLYAKSINRIEGCQVTGKACLTSDWKCTGSTNTMGYHATKPATITRYLADGFKAECVGRVKFNLLNSVEPENVTTYYVERVNRLKKSLFKKGGKVTFIIHGWKQGSSDLKFLRNQMAKTGGPVFSVDWKPWSADWWLPSPCKDTDYVGSVIAQFIRGLENNSYVTRDKIHLIGFSLGGKVAAATAKHLGAPKLMRISGLDVPPICGSPGAPKLDESDAEFVDTVRTSVLSFTGKQGHADFFLCDDCLSDLLDIKDAHREAVEVYAHSVDKGDCELTGKACLPLAVVPLKILCQGTERTLGYYATKPPSPTKHLTTSVPEKCLKDPTFIKEEGSKLCKLF